MSGRCILVTGAASVIGKALLPRLLADGYRVIAQTRRPDPDIERLHAEFGERCQRVAVDLCSENLGATISAALSASPVPLDGLVHLPSAPVRLERLPKTPTDAFRDHMDVAVLSLHTIVSSIWKPIVKSADFRVIAVNSAALAEGAPPKGMSPYLVSKAALSQYLRCLDSELGGANVRINQVSPGMFRSPLLSALPEYIIEQFAGGEAEPGESSGQIDPAIDIVPSILFLLSSDARKISGSNIGISTSSN